jgi:hypothetical protein
MNLRSMERYAYEQACLRAKHNDERGRCRICGADASMVCDAISHRKAEHGQSHRFSIPAHPPDPDMFRFAYEWALRSIQTSACTFEFAEQMMLMWGAEAQRIEAALKNAPRPPEPDRVGGRMSCPLSSCPMEHRLYEPDEIRVERGDWHRASGLVECLVCGLPCYDHAPVTGFPWLHRICDGRLVKL